VTAAGFPHPQPTPRGDRLYTVFQALDAAIQREGEALQRFADTIAQARANRTAECDHAFPDPYPKPLTQIGPCRNCGTSYQEAAAVNHDPEPDDEDDGPWCRTDRSTR
jgi:hypothetical protein